MPASGVDNCYRIGTTTSRDFLSEDSTSPDRKALGKAVLILGINAYHGDSSACLLRDGILIAAAEEERFRRLKHWAGFPSEAISYCLAAAGARLSDLDQVALNQDSRANLTRKVLYVLRNRPQFGLLASELTTRRKRAARQAPRQHCRDRAPIRASRAT